MSTYRIYVDSRERVEGTDTNFTFELPYSLSIKEKSLAMIDVVCTPNSILIVTTNKNDTIWVRETRSFEETFYRFCKIQEGYYTVQTLRQAIQDALNNGRYLFPEYKVEYDQRLARYLFSNPFTISGESFLLYTQESLKIEAHQDTPPLSAVILELFVRLGW